MVQLARHNINFAPQQASEPGLKIVRTCRKAYLDVRDLGYAPNPLKLEGRQLEVAQLVALGLADKEIAHALSVSQSTVKGHVSMILRLLGLYRRTQICRYVYETGLFPKA